MIRVIVADDEQKVSQLICNLVEWDKLDMEVVGVAQNGLEALDLIGMHLPHLLITDIRMPGCDGLELVRRAKAVNPELEIIIISGYRYFDYAQTAIQYGVSDYLLKPVNKEDLTATLQKMRAAYLQRTQKLSEEERLRHRLQDDTARKQAELFGLLMEGGTPLPSLETLNREYHFAMRPGLYRVGYLQIDGDYDAMAAGGLAVMGDKSAAILREALGPLCHEVALHRQDGCLAVVLNYEEEQSRAVRTAARAALDEIRVQNNMFKGMGFTLALGSEQADACALPVSAASGLFTLRERLLRGGGKLLETLPEHTAGEALEGLLADTIGLLEAAVDIQDSEAAAALLRDYAAKLLELDGVSGQDILAACRQLYLEYLLLMRRLRLPIEDVDGLLAVYDARAGLCGSATDVLRCMEEAITSTLHEALEQKHGEEAKPIRAAKLFIQENYMRPITLEEVSGVAGFNASYFSSLFKKETGQNFLEYLSSIRMGKAKELLRETSQSITTICEQVGYTDLKYFTKSFKKATGVKPGEYRKLYS